jgi:ABC-2 type transport system permease protein/sodium transport system permease protein
MNKQDDSAAFRDARTPKNPVTPSNGHPVIPSSSRFDLGRLGRLVRKELSEILRDRRTIITLVLMPLLLYPLLGMAFPQFLVSLAGEPARELRIGVPAPTDAELRAELEGRADTQARVIARALRQGTAVPSAYLAGVVFAPAGGGSLAAVPVLFTWREAVPSALPLPPGFDPLHRGGRPPPQLVLFEANDLDAAVRDGQVDLGIRLRSPTAPKRWLGLNWELIYREDSASAAEALALVERLSVAASAQQLWRELGQYRNAPPAVPVRLLRRPLTEGGGGGLRVSLTALVPLILILMTITGAVYPAIDLTAGERERGTLEILVAAPVPRLALLFAKYVSVVTVAILTATVNLVMMTVTLQVSGLAGALGSGFELTLGTVLQVFGLLLLFAAFFSAVLLVLTSFARSFKEAQAYLIPLMLVSLAPGILGMMPGLPLAGVYAVTPLLNIVLLGRDLFAGKAELAAAGVVVFSTLVYALAALAVAARIFGAESVLYSEQTAWADLFRRPARQQSAASPAAALLFLALLFPLYYFATRTLIAPAGPGEREVFQVLMTLLLFVALPLLAGGWGRLRLSEAFRMRPAPWLAYPAAALLGAALIPPVFELLALLQRLGLQFVPAEQVKQHLQAQLDTWRALPAWVVCGSVAVMGAAEELFFRGYLFSALRRAGGMRTALLGSAVLFGLFHFVSWFDRLLPSTLMGLVLGWVCWRTGSVWPGMLLHAVYDAGAVLLAYRGVGSEGASGLPLEWVAAGLVGVALGAALIRYGRPAEPEGADSSEDSSASPDPGRVAAQDGTVS